MLPIPVFRVEKNANYTTMSNYHLRDNTISFKAKGILALLDIMLPKIDGYGVCEVIRQKSQVPIIMLTALSDEENQLKGFKQQIDDYIPKPFSPRILLCKIAAILRRRTAENQNPSLLTYKELSIDVDGFHVYQGGNEVVLTSKEFALLRLMLENQGKVFTRQMLLDRLWAEDLEVEDQELIPYLTFCVSVESQQYAEDTLGSVKSYAQNCLRLW